MMIVRRVSDKFQITLPKVVRDALGLKPGDEFVYQIDGVQVVLTKAPDSMCNNDIPRDCCGLSGAPVHC